MNKSTTISPIEAFRLTFPDHRLKASEDELRYLFNSRDCANAYELAAMKIILERRLPLTAHVEEWSSKGKVTEIAMVVRPAPEEYTFADEVQDDEGLTGGWWNKEE